MKKKNDTLMKVLIVDDDEFMQDLLTRYLRRLSYDVVTAGSGERALEYGMHIDFDLALVDILLGKMNGIEVVAKLKNMQPDLIFILMTGHPTLETALQAIEKGVNDYLIKPFKLEQLGDVIDKCQKSKASSQKIKSLQDELTEARKKIQKYEAILSHGHRIKSQQRPDHIAARLTLDREHSLYGYQKDQHTLENQLENLKILRDNDLIELEEFESREQRLKTMISKGRSSGQ